MEQNSTQPDVDQPQEAEADRLARTRMKHRVTQQAEQRRADARAEYDSVGDERRAQSAKLKSLRMLKEAKARLDAKAS